MWRSRITRVAAAQPRDPADPWRLGAVHSITTLTGSALLALAVAHGRLSAEQAWAAAHVDEDWNMEQWGRTRLRSSAARTARPRCRRPRRCWR